MFHVVAAVNMNDIASTLWKQNKNKEMSTREKKNSNKKKRFDSVFCSSEGKGILTVLKVSRTKSEKTF